NLFSLTARAAWACLCATAIAICSPAFSRKDMISGLNRSFLRSLSWRRPRIWPPLFRGISARDSYPSLTQRLRAVNEEDSPLGQRDWPPALLVQTLPSRVNGRKPGSQRPDK